ncbi:lipopolysaccharide transport periplasmic protein LptA [Arenimonas sp.]|uniref:lipopolysaccharide transport periplasmic protein LptA n=1 Tax=Arenimonas sp. TaxID=1872635 RepID=UPI002D1FA086|nr:lipopolysaccharide transport periplasmic protein LptA [Arenimonas sp.]
MRLAARNSRLLTLALIAALPLAAQAKTTDRNQPMDVAADHTDAVLADDGDAILTGNVRITQGTLEVDADRAVIKRKNGDIAEVVLTGAPAHLKQVSDTGEPMNARAAQIVYTLSSDLMVLTGGVVVEQPRGNLSGETIKYDLKTGRLDGGGDGRRVSMHILPKTTTAGSKPAEETTPAADGKK